MVSLLRHTVVTLTFLAGLSLFAVLLLVRVARPVAWWPIEAVDALTPVTFVPFLIVASVAVLVWSRSLAILSLAALLLFAPQFDGPLLTAAGLSGPAVVTASQGRSHLRILTLNLHAPNDDPSPFVALVREADPDVVVFQEVTSDFARAFDRLLGQTYPVAATAGAGANHQGSGTWSRWPLSERT